MDSTTVERQITEAHGLALLGLHQDAWGLLESLPADARATLPAFAVRLVFCRNLEKWELGSELVKIFTRQRPLGEREAAGRFLLAYAIHLLSTGDVIAAQEQLQHLSKLWPEGYLEALASPRLRSLLKDLPGTK